MTTFQKGKIAEVVFKHICNWPCSTIAEIAEAVGETNQTVKNVVQSLRNRELVQSTSKDKGVAQRYVQVVQKEVSTIEKRILDAVRRTPGIGTQDVVKQVREPLWKVQKTLSMLRDKGDIVHSGVRATGSGWSMAVQEKQAPRQTPIKNGTTTGPWTAPKWELARPGAEDHKQHGSLRGETVQPWIPPISMCVGKGVERFMPDRLQR